MIKLSKVDGREIIVNADEIETIETQYDTTISLKSGKKIIVREQSKEIIDKVIEFKKLCFSKLPDYI